jgi:chemotaxis protein histidine kinase CheA
MEGEGADAGTGRPAAPGSPRRSRSTTPEQRAALRKQKEDRQRRARRRQQGLPDESAPAPAPAEPDLDAIIKQAEAERTRAAEKEAAAAAAASAEEERQKVEREELAAAEVAAAAAAAAAAKAAEEKAAAERAAADERAAAEAKRLAGEEAAAAAAADVEVKVKAKAKAEAEAGAGAGAAASAAADVEREQAADTSHTERAEPAGPGLIVLNVSKGSAGFTCAEDLTVVKLPPGKKGSQAEVAGVMVGMRCVAFQGVPLDGTTTWSILKEQVKAAQKPWSFTFSSGAVETDTTVDDGLAGSEAEQPAQTHDEEPASSNQQGLTVVMTPATRSMIEEGWHQPAWISPTRDTPSTTPSQPSKPAEMQGVVAGADYIIVAWTMPSGELLALDFEVQVTKKRGGSMVVVAREHLSVNHNDRWMVRHFRTRLRTRLPRQLSCANRRCNAQMVLGKGRAVHRNHSGSEPR